MFNTAAKFGFGVAGVALVLAIGYAFAESGDPGGFVLLMAVFLAATVAALALTLSGIRDTAPRYADEAPSLETVSIDRSFLTRPSYWPLVAAGSAGVLCVGLATGRVVVTVGLVLSLLVAGSWLAQDWREDPRWTPRLEARTSDRLIAPLALPLLALGLVAVIVLSVSRILLAVSKHASVAVAFAFALALLVAFFAIASKPRLGRSVIAGLSSVALIALIAAGSVGAAHGERRFEQHVTAGPTFNIVAHNISYNVSQLTVPSGQAVTIHFANRETKDTYHDIAVYTQDKQPVVAGEPVHGGQRITYHFQFAAGAYVFRCDFHPTMVGTLTVQG